MREKKIYSIAIDGPSGAGKSTLAKAVAEKLKIVYVDTGAIYRSVGYYVYQHGISGDNEAAIEAVLPLLNIEMRYQDGTQHMFLNGEDITRQIRLPEISLYASKVSAIPAVRAFLLEMQRDMARQSSVIMDGRDIGSVVLPEADVKIYLFASPQVRARRRMKELEERGTPQPYEEVLRQIEERDWADTHREIAPLRPTEDAVLVDTSELDFRQSEERLLNIIQGRLALA
jgi:cytidylate kinase